MLDINPGERTQPEIGQKLPTDRMPRAGGPSMGPEYSAVPQNIFAEGEAEKTRLVGYFTIAAMILVLVGSWTLYFIKSNKASRLATKVTTTQELSARLKAPELKAIDEAATRYSAGLKQLSTFMSNLVKTPELFNRLETLTPEETTLNSFSVDNKGIIKITGQSQKMTGVASLIKSLEVAPEFSNIVLEKNQLVSTSSEQAEHYSFSLTCGLDTKQIMGNKKTTAAK